MSERGVFDLRIHVTGADTTDVWARATELQRWARLFAPAGVDVRYLGLKDGQKTHDFDATMKPKRKRRVR